MIYYFNCNDFNIYSCLTTLLFLLKLNFPLATLLAPARLFTRVLCFSGYQSMPKCERPALSNIRDTHAQQDATSTHTHTHTHNEVRNTLIYIGMHQHGNLWVALQPTSDSFGSFRDAESCPPPMSKRDWKPKPFVGCKHVHTHSCLGQCS